MVPDAPIDGKLPSVKPEDRSGDFTFSRGSNLAATRVNKDGLIEKGRENLLLQSNQFDTTWGTLDSEATIGQIGYDGSNNAWLVSKTDLNGRVQQNIVTSGVQTFSVYVKAGTKNWVALRVDGSGVNTYFDLQNGVVGFTSNTIEANIKSLGNDWYRCSVTLSSGITRVRIYVADGDNDTSGTSGSIYIQDAQLELGLVATDYIETTTATVQKGILENLPRLDYSGGASCPSLLLEPQRSNILRQSEYLGGEFSLDNVSLDYNYGTSPEGVTNSALLTQTGSSSSNSMYEFNLPTTDGSYAYSFFFKAGTSTSVRMYVGTGVPEDFNPQTITAGYSGGTLNILFEDYGNGWWRASATQTLSGAPYNRFSVYPDRGNQGRNVEIWGTQIEVGSYHTSYIPTYGSSVTRSLDVSSLGGLQTSSILNGTKGTFLFEGIKNQDWYFTNFVITANSKTNKSLLIDNSGSAIRLRAWDTSGLDATITTLGISNGTFKYLIRWDNGDLKVFINGVSGGTATISPYSYTTLDLSEGTWSRSSPKQLLFFPTALTDDECIALTTI